MSLMSDVDIRRALAKDIVIWPFASESLTPIGYDFSVGEFVFSIEHGLLEPHDGFYSLPAKSTVQILTRESLWVSNRIGGTFHSKVSLVSKGLSHISTTLDPKWYGPLLITLRNNTDAPIELAERGQFVTLLFYRVQTPTPSDHGKPPYRRDILAAHLSKQTAAYIDKVAAILGDDPITQSAFKSAVDEANRPMLAKVASSLRRQGARELADAGLRAAILLAIVLLVALPSYWDRLSGVLHNISYDTKVFAMQVTAIIALVSLLLSLRRPHL
jgi:deoxycytidine triphosphate deaminase